MKIMINYNFLERISEVKEKSKVFKLVRHERKLFALIFTGFFSIYMLATQDVTKAFVRAIIFGFSNFFAQRLTKENIRKIELNAENDLIRLCIMLQDLNVKTSYELLLESYMYDKKYKLCLDENKMPYILESKYIMVPRYTYNDDIDETSIMQEHVVGSKEYVLSLGTPKRDFKLAFSGA